jgi:hypothetical protein
MNYGGDVYNIMQALDPDALGYVAGLAVGSVRPEISYPLGRKPWLERVQVKSPAARQDVALAENLIRPDGAGVRGVRVALAENLIRPGEARARGRGPHVYGCCWPCTGLPVAAG